MATAMASLKDWSFEQASLWRTLGAVQSVCHQAQQRTIRSECTHAHTYASFTYMHACPRTYKHRYTYGHMQLLSFLRLVNMNDKTRVIEIESNKEMIELWEEGRIDGAFTWDPHLSILQRRFDAQILITSGTREFYVVTVFRKFALAGAAILPPIFVAIVFRRDSLPSEYVHACMWVHTLQSMEWSHFRVVRDILRALMACDNDWNTVQWNAESSQVKAIHRLFQQNSRTESRDQISAGMHTCM